MSETAPKRWLTESILIASIPVVGYGLCFACQAGYANYFGIPLELISITIPQILLALASLCSVGLLIFGLSYVAYDLMSKKSKENFIVKHLSQYSVQFLLFTTYLFLFGSRWQHWVGIGAVLAAFLLGDFIFPLLSQKNKPTYKEKLEAQSQVESKAMTNSLMGVLTVTHGRENIKLLFYVLILLSISYGVGESYATRKVDYLVDVPKINTVVLAIYDNRYVEAEYDPRTGIVFSKFVFASFANKTQFEFQRLKIGPLTPQK